MNRLNARIEYWYNVAAGSLMPIPGLWDRESHKHAVEENHRYCDIADAIRRGYKKEVIQ